MEIDFDVTPAQASLGELVSVRWAVTGTTDVKLQSAGGLLSSLTGPHGTVRFPAMDADQFTLVAVGLDGRQHQRECRLDVQGIGLVDITPELNLLKPKVFDERPSVVSRVWQQMKEAVA